MPVEALTDSIIALTPMMQIIILMSLAGSLGVTVTIGECEQEWFYPYQWTPATNADAYEVYELLPGAAWTISTVVFEPSVWMRVKPPGRDGVKVRGVRLDGGPVFGPFSEVSEPEPRIERE